MSSRINRTNGSSASERALYASQSLFTLRQVTVSLPTAPKTESAREMSRRIEPNAASLVQNLDRVSVMRASARR